MSWFRSSCKKSFSCLILPSPRSIMAKTALQLASPSSLVAIHVYKPASLVRQSRIHSPPESWASDGGRSSSLRYQVSEGFGNPATDTLSRISQPVPTAALRSLRLKTGGMGSWVVPPVSGPTWSLVTLGLLEGMTWLGLDPGRSAILISLVLLYRLHFLSGNWLGYQDELQLLKAFSERLQRFRDLLAHREYTGCRTWAVAPWAAMTRVHQSEWHQSFV